MKRLLNTLYITSTDSYLALEGENVVVKNNDQEIARIPLHNLESIITFGYTGASPALMGACAKRNIALSFMTASGRFLARTVGEVKGNVTLRKAQYRLADNDEQSAAIAKNFIIGKSLEFIFRTHYFVFNKKDTDFIPVTLQSVLVQRIACSNEKSYVPRAGKRTFV